MERPPLTFRELIAPLPADDFLTQHLRRKPVYIPGDREKFGALFSWQALNEILRMTTLWSDRSLELTFDGKTLLAEHYCFKSSNRDNVESQNVDFHKVMAYLSKGATMTLNFVERLIPSLRAQSQSLASALWAPANRNVFVSWDRQAGYATHFDNVQVFVCQIAGTKRWRVYQNRFPNAANLEGARHTDFPQSFHEGAKGQSIVEAELRPGDLLYIPHGFYHDAVATPEATMHLSFGVRYLLVQDFIKRLVADLPRDPHFREHILYPLDLGFDEDHRGRVAGRLGDIIEDARMGDDLQRFLHAKTYERIFDFDFPNREMTRQYRVCWFGKQLKRAGNAWVLSDGSARHHLDPTEAELAQWVISQDYFSRRWIEEDLPGVDAASVERAIGTFRSIGLIEAF